MKTNYLLRFALLSVLCLLGPAASMAADRYNISFSMAGKTTNDVRLLVNQSFNRAIVLGNISRTTSIPVADLAMIYERTSGLVLVVDRNYGTNIAELLRLENELSVGNTNLTRYEVFMKVSHPELSYFDGSAVATTTIKRDSLGEETGFKMTGKIHLSVEESGVD